MLGHPRLLVDNHRLLVTDKSTVMHHVINCQFHEVRRSTFGTHAFSVARPTVWNSLPAHL